MRKAALALAVALISFSCSHATLTAPPNRFGLHVVSSVPAYLATVRANPDNRLVDLGSFLPFLHLQLHYATSENFMHRQLYPVAKAFLRRPAAIAIWKVEVDLKRRGLGLEIWDAYRPYRVTEEMWEPFKNPDFVADPAKGSRHNRGAAVDVTLIDLKTGQELDMPTPHDEFSPRAAAGYTELPGSVQHNRQILQDAMRAHGFQLFPSEWWHFDYSGWQSFDLMDVPLEQLPDGGKTKRAAGAAR